MDITTHQTSGGIIVRRNQENYLFLLLRKQQREGLEWIFPKGHIESQESSYQAAIREVTEETGIDELHYIGALGTLFFSYQQEDGLHEKYVDWYLFETSVSKVIPSEEEKIIEGKWCHYQEAIALLTHANTLPFLHQAYTMLTSSK